MMRLVTTIQRRAYRNRPPSLTWYIRENIMRAAAVLDLVFTIRRETRLEHLLFKFSK